MLEKVRIKNFRSLRDVELDLQRVNLCIGPNNSGKTNFLKAFEFLKDCIVKPKFDFPVSHSFKSHLQGKLVVEKDIDFEFEFKTKKSLSRYLYLSLYEILGQFEFQIFIGEGRQHFSLKNLATNFRLEDVDSQFHKYVYFDSGNTIGNYSAAPQQFESKVQEIFDQNENVKGVYMRNVGFADNEYDISATEDDYSIYKMIRGYAWDFPEGMILLNSEIYEPDPYKIREMYPVREESFVNRNAANLTAFLQVMRNKYEENYNRIVNDLHNCVPNFKAINFEYVDVSDDHPIRQLYKKDTLAILGLTAFDGTKYWAEELSEGTLYFLALLCIIHQPNPPKLLLLEEPEKGIHPRRIREVMDLIFQLAEEKDIQIIMTTHSVHVVDEFADRPESVFIFEMEEGETKVKNLLKDVIEPSNEKTDAAGVDRIPYTSSLGEHWAMGFLGGVPD